MQIVKRWKAWRTKRKSIKEVRKRLSRAVARMEVETNPFRILVMKSNIRNYQETIETLCK